MSQEWRPRATLEVLRARAELLARARAFFSGRSILEVETPVCSQAAGTDPAIEPLQTSYSAPGAADGLRLYLQSSPEYAMKRLLAAGTGPIYQITRAFRNGESGRFHNPEFSILEWYRPGFDHHQLMDELVDCVRSCLNMGDLEQRRLTYTELFEGHLSLNPLTATVSDLQQALKVAGVDLSHPEAADDPDALLDLLMAQVIEPQLKETACVLVYDFPASKASLAQLNPENPQVAQRFELYLYGVEIANGFHELADATEQRRRFESDNQWRLAHQQTTYDLDERLLAALEAGLPDCSGVALGLDRLLMVKLGLTEIGEALAFPLDRA